MKSKALAMFSLLFPGKIKEVNPPPRLQQVVRTVGPESSLEVAILLVTARGLSARHGGRASIGPIPSLRIALQLQQYGDDLTTILAGITYAPLKHGVVCEETLTESFGADVVHLAKACMQPFEFHRNDIEAYDPRVIAIRIVAITEQLMRTPPDEHEALNRLIRKAEKLRLIGGKRLPMRKKSPHILELNRVLQHVSRRNMIGQPV